ncbi:MAG: zeta toxin family protein [Candidatus Micrarchaeota archaeon]|nr:zeta toxin family protein [Candidatus Micrarchaeota archaeon]
MHRHRSSHTHEIERKFLVNTIPNSIDLQALPKKRIHQNYLIVGPESELRIRQEGDSYLLTVKHGNGLVRRQPEIALSREQFEALWDSNGSRLEKTRYYIPLGGGQVHVDVYKGPNLEGLVTAEVEFGTKAEARRFRPPWWFGQEVTYDSDYRNSALAMREEPIPQPQRLSVPSELEIGLEELSRRAAALLFKKEEGSIVVLVSGGSGSGKTTVAERFDDRLKDDAVVISMDHYYKSKRRANFDEPDAVDLDLLAEHLAALLSGKSIERPVYDFKTSSRLDEHVTVPPKRVLIVEGLYALHPKIRKFGDISVFVDVGAHGRMIRRLIRDSQRTSMSVFETLRYVTQVAEPMYREHILPTKASADIVIRNDYDPRREARGIETVQSQLKYKAPNLTDEMLRREGFNRIASVKQSDRYYVPLDSPVGGDEVIMLREEVDIRKLAEVLASQAGKSLEKYSNMITTELRERIEEMKGEVEAAIIKNDLNAMSDKASSLGMVLQNVGHDAYPASLEQVIFTYKGPSAPRTDSMERNTLSFVINKDTEMVLSSIYSTQPSAAIIKDRAIYHSGGIVLSFDTRIAVCVQSTFQPVNHVEFTLPPGASGKKMVERVAARLGLTQADQINKPYREMA